MCSKQYLTILIQNHLLVYIMNGIQMPKQFPYKFYLRQGYGEGARCSRPTLRTRATAFLPHDNEPGPRRKSSHVFQHLYTNNFLMSTICLPHSLSNQLLSC